MSYKQTIYNRFRQHGLTEAAALAFLGNWECESGNEPYRLQGDFSPYRTVSKSYVERCMSGNIGKAEFCDGRVGKFLAQWTYPTRQAALWDFWKASGKALDDAAMQVDFAVHELETDYKPLLEFLKSTTDVFTATSRICREYERPAFNNIDARFDDANKIRNEIDLDAWDDGGITPDPQPEPEPKPQKDELVLRTIDQNCNGFDEVYLLQSLLLCRGYEVIVSGVWDYELTDCVKVFQRHNGLEPVDGVVGKNTWNKLMERKGG